MKLRSFALSLLGLLSLGGGPSPAKACYPPPDFWWIQGHSPSAGGQIDPSGGYLLWIMNPGDQTFPPERALTVEVHCDGVAMTGSLDTSEYELAHWRPEQPLVEGSVCQFHVQIDPFTTPDAPDVVRYAQQATLVAKVVRQPPPPAPDIISARAETWVQSIQECVGRMSADSFENCGDCRSYRTVQRIRRLQVAVGLRPPSVPEPGGYVARLYVAPTEAELATSRPLLVERFWDKPLIGLTLDLGPVVDWLDHPPCFRVEWQAPVGPSVSSPPTCLQIEGETEVPEQPRLDAGASDASTPPDATIESRADAGSGERDPEEAAAGNSGGCATAPLPMPACVALLALLPALRRRRAARQTPPGSGASA